MKNVPKEMLEKTMLWLGPTLAAVLLLLFFVAHSSYSQTISPTAVQTTIGTLRAIDAMTLFSADAPVMSDPGANDPSTTDPPHLSKGTNWALFGTAKDDLDPQNAFNPVISFDTRDPSNNIAGAYRKFGPRVKVEQLTDQVALKYYLHGRTCGNGSPRMQLGIDKDGDGKFDANAFGYVGAPASGGGCPMDMWTYQDLTMGNQWDLSQLAGCIPYGATWTDMETCLNTFYPHYQVVNAVFVDDGVASGNATGAGCASFDQVTAGKDTLDEWDDTSGGSKQNTCSPN